MRVDSMTEPDHSAVCTELSTTTTNLLQLLNTSCLQEKPTTTVSKGTTLACRMHNDAPSPKESWKTPAGSTKTNSHLTT